jgi:hypothetical protein
MGDFFLALNLVSWPFFLWLVCGKPGEALFLKVWEAYRRAVVAAWSAISAPSRRQAAIHASASRWVDEKVTSSRIAELEADPEVLETTDRLIARIDDELYPERRERRELAGKMRAQAASLTGAPRYARGGVIASGARPSCPECRWERIRAYGGATIRDVRVYTCPTHRRLDARS